MGIGRGGSRRVEGGDGCSVLVPGGLLSGGVSRDGDVTMGINLFREAAARRGNEVIFSAGSARLD